MTTLQKSHDVDLEAGNYSSVGGGGGAVPAASEDGGPPPTVNAKENVGKDKNGEEKKESSVSECSVVIVDLESEVPETKLCLAKTERDCRICHLSLDVANQDSGVSIELGCSCKDDLGVAHKKCAEAWFKIKGNITCEICGSIAQNVVVVVIESDSSEELNEESNDASSITTESRRFWQRHRFLNFLLGCVVVAFIISWFFHFNVVD